MRITKQTINNLTAIILTMVLYTIAPSNSMAQTEATFGYLSYNSVLKNMPQYKEAQNKLQNLRNEYDKEMVRAEDNFSKQFAEYIDGQKSFSENILLKRQKELQTLMEQSLQFKEEAKKLLAKAEAETMAPVYDKLNEAIKKVGENKKLDYIINTDNNNCPFINKSKGEDVTQFVIAETTNM